MAAECTTGSERGSPGAAAARALLLGASLALVVTPAGFTFFYGELYMASVEGCGY